MPEIPLRERRFDAFLSRAHADKAVVDRVARLAGARRARGLVRRDAPSAGREDRQRACRVLAHGFGRARCPARGHDVLVAFSCRAPRRLFLV